MKSKKPPISASFDEQLTPNFRLKEFHSKDGASMPYDVYLNIKELAKQLQHLRDINEKPITINSGYRSRELNRKVGGASNSYHMKGMAADFTIRGITPKQVREIIEVQCDLGKMPCGGLGAYSTFTHYDIRKTKARWNA
jgi:uncharacterized protein YcbK (DUF882 family)